MSQQTNPSASGLNTFDHVVVLMLENRSFDNLLGYLYKDGVPAGKKFAGLQEGVFENPVPSRAKGYRPGLINPLSGQAQQCLITNAICLVVDAADGEIT